MRKFLAIILLGNLLLSSCAMIVKSSRQQVFFKGGPEKGITKIQSPDGNFTIENGSGSYLMTRSKPNIPIKVTCPDGTVKAGQIETINQCVG